MIAPWVGEITKVVVVPPFLLPCKGNGTQNIPFGLGVDVLKENIASFLTEYKISLE